MVMGMARHGELPEALSKLQGSALIARRASAMVTALAAPLSIGPLFFEVISKATLFLLVLYFLGDVSLCLAHRQSLPGSVEVPIVVPLAGAFANFVSIVYFMVFEFTSSRAVPALMLGSSFWHAVARCRT